MLRILGLRATPPKGTATAKQVDRQVSPNLPPRGWSIRAFFKSPRGQPPARSIHTALLPLVAAARRPRRSRRRASAAPTASALAAEPIAEPGTLQHALSIKPRADIADTPVTVAAPAGTLPANVATPSTSKSSHGGARSRTPLPSSAPSHQPTQQLLQCNAEAAELAEAAQLAAATAELATMRHRAAQQAAALADYLDSATAVRLEAEEVEAQLACRRSKAAALEEQAQDVRGVAAWARRLADMKVADLQYELQQLADSTAAELSQLAASTAHAQRLTDSVVAASLELAADACTAQHRCELMTANHKPLTQAQHAKQEKAIDDYWMLFSRNDGWCRPEMRHHFDPTAAWS